MDNNKQYYKNLIKSLEIASGQVISIIGSGGKTTLMLGLADALKDQYRVLVTTTTKIFKPIGDPYRVDIEAPESYLLDLGNRKIERGFTYVYGSDAIPCLDYFNREQIKVSGFSKSVLDQNHNQLLKAFDIVIIEADGSRNRPFKGWREDEPIVTDASTMTIGVVGTHHLGVSIAENNIHRLDAFRAFLEGHVVQSGDDQVVTKEILLTVVTSPKGIFAKAKGQKVLYLAGASDELATWFREKLHEHDIRVLR